MSRYDKYDPKVGGFRARLAADFAYTATNPDYAHADLDKLFAVGMNTTGQIGKAGVTGFVNFVGVMVLTKPKAAGDVVDIMTSGEIVELIDAEILAGDLLSGGQALYASPATTTTGQLTAVATAGNFYVGRTAEINSTTGRARLVVRSMFRAA